MKSQFTKYPSGYVKASNSIGDIDFILADYGFFDAIKNDAIQYAKEHLSFNDNPTHKILILEDSGVYFAVLVENLFNGVDTYRDLGYDIVGWVNDYAKFTYYN